jgi:hypothetical protein
MVESKSQAKSFGIDKRVVWEAWKQVRADRGAAGVDEEAVAQVQATEGPPQAGLEVPGGRVRTRAGAICPLESGPSRRPDGGSRMSGDVHVRF